jgi:hypothetical protein
VFLVSCGASAPVVVESEGLLAATPTLPATFPVGDSTLTPVPPTSTPAPTTTASPLPTLELPTLASNPPALEVWDGPPTYLADSAAGYYFRVRYDPQRWALVIDQLGQAALSHRQIPYCTITPSAGRGLPPGVRVEHEIIYAEGLSIDVGKAFQGDRLVFITYQVSDGTIFTGFEVNFQEDSQACASDALDVIETMRPVPVSQATPQP